MAEEDLLKYVDDSTDTQNQGDDLLQFIDTPDKSSQIKANVFSSTSISPDAATQQWKTSKETNLPVDIVRTQEDQIKQNQEFESIDYNNLVKDSPKVADQLADPNKTAAIRDDLSNLSYFEKLKRRVFQDYKTSDENVEKADLLIKAMIHDYSGNKDYELTPLEQNRLNLIDKNQAGRPEIDTGFTAPKASEITASRLATLPFEFLGKEATNFVVPSTVSAIPTIAANIPETLEGVGLGGGAGFLLGGIPGAIAGGKIGSKAGLAVGAAKLETGLAYDELSKLVDENGAPIEKSVAVGGSLATGVTNGLLELIPFEIGADSIKKAFSRQGIKELAKTPAGREAFKNIGQLALAEGVTEALQELSNIVFSESAKSISTGDFRKMGMKDENDTLGFLTFLSDSATRVSESFKGGAGAGLGLGTVTGGISYAKNAATQRNQNKVEQEQIQEISSKVDESKILKRSPDLFKEVTKDTLGEENIYINPEEIQTYFQTKSPEELEQFYQSIPGVREKIQDAIETGQDIVLPANQAFVATKTNPGIADLEKSFRLTPNTLNEKEAQDTFINDVANTVVSEETQKQESASQDEVKNNIKKQILGLRLPTNESQDLITTLTSYYDTRTKRYGSDEAKDVLNKYLRNLEIKNGTFSKKLEAKDDLDVFINKARKKPAKATKPLLKFLKEKGGVKIGSNLAGELNAIGITHKTAPALFRKENGVGDVDNIPLSEFQERFKNLEVKGEGDYVNRQFMLDLLQKEVAGADITKDLEQDEINKFHESLAQMDIDINTATNEQIKKAIKDFQGYNQSAFHGTPHIFDKFTLDKIGTGEGAQAYGWGLYFAGNKKVAEFYRQKLTKDKTSLNKNGIFFTKEFEPKRDLVSVAAKNHFMFDALAGKKATKKSDIESIIKILERDVNNSELEKQIGKEELLKEKADLKTLKELKEKNIKGEKGAIYEVSIPENEEMLQWDSLFNKQSEKVKEALTKVFKEIPEADLEEYLDKMNVENIEDLNGREIYQIIKRSHTDDLLPALPEEFNKSLRDDEYASKYLHSIGIQGVKYLDGASRGKGDGNYNYVIFDDEAIEILKTYYQGKNKDPQGTTQFIGQKPIITLFKNKNKSTLLHELGHVFLQIENEIAQIPTVSDQVKKDWKTIEDWLEIKDGKITTEAHEKFARGFESYLREGKAPSVGLRNAFRRFRNWLVRIYRNVKQLDVELNDNVRDYFDRLLATDDAIESFKNSPLYKADERVLELLNEEEKARYLKLTQSAFEKGKDKLLVEAIRDGEVKDLKSYQNKRKEVRDRVAEDLAQTPTYRLLDFLKTGKLDGEEVAEPYKLNRNDIENYEGDFLSDLPTDIISEDGAPIAVVAEEFGFSDPGEMLNALATAPNFKTEVNRITNSEMNSLYSDVMNDGSMQDEAIEALENDAKANKILFELNVANRKIKTTVETRETYKQKAKAILSVKKVKDALDTNSFYLAEVRATRESGIALGKKDFEKAVEWKKKQLLNHYLFQESLALKNEYEDNQNRYKRYRRPQVVGKVWIEEDYRERIVNLLRDFGEALKPIGYQITNVPELEAWKKEQTEEGVLGLVPFPEIAAFQKTDQMKNLSVSQYRDLNDAISNLGHVGQGLRSIKIEGDRKQLDAIADELVDTVNANIKEDKVTSEDPTAREKLRRDFDAYASSLIKTNQTTLKIDGEKDLGKFYEYFERAVNLSELKKEEMKNEAYKKFDEIFNKHFGGYKIDKKRTYFERVGRSYSKPAVLSFALNWGTETNRRRVRDGYNYNNDQVISIMSSLTKNELGFVQDVWDMINSYWPQAEATQKKLFGISPKKQRAVPFTIKSADGHIVEMKGGYYPLAYGEESSLLSTTKEDLKNLVAAPTSDRIGFHASYTKERSEEKITKKIELSLNPLTKHINQVITDIAMKEAVWNSYKVINNRKLSAALIKKIGVPEYKQLQTWLYDMYGRTQVQEAYIGKLTGLSRSIATTYTMGFKLATAMIQITGLAQSAVKVGYRNMGNGIWKALGNGNPVSINQATKLAFAKSKILEDRSKTINRDIYEVMDRIQKSGKMTKAVAKFAFLLTTKAQMLVDIPTWYAGYYKGLKDYKGDDAKAVELADKLLIETQGSSYKQSQSAIERNEAAIVKAFTVFYSYMNVKLNLFAGSYRKTNFKKPKDVASFASDFMLLFLVDALATEYLRGGVSNLLAGRDDDGDDGEENKWLHQANLIGGSLASSIPGISQLYSGFSGYSFIPSGFKGIEIAGKGVKNLGTQAVKSLSEDEEADLLKTLRALNDSLSVFTVGGGGQIDIFLKAAQEEEKGNNPAPIDYILKPPK